MCIIMLQQWERINSFMISFDRSRKKLSVTLILVIEQVKDLLLIMSLQVLLHVVASCFCVFFFFGLSLSFQLNYLLFFIPPCSLDH